MEPFFISESCDSDMTPRAFFSEWYTGEILLSGHEFIHLRVGSIRWVAVEKRLQSLHQ